MHSMHPTEPSAWIRRFAPLIAPHAAVLDVACGDGRHARWLAARGHPVVGIDRDAAALAALRADGIDKLICADLENAPWPLPGARFPAVIVTNYLWRPLFAALRDSVAAGGLLLYETYALGQEALGHPRNPDFLLRPGELLQQFPAPAWHVIAYEDGYDPAPRSRVQRIAVARADAQVSATAYALAADRTAPAGRRLDGLCTP